MKKDYQKQNIQAGPQKPHEPRPVGEIIEEMMQTSDEPLWSAWRGRLFKDAHPDTHLCVEVKTLLRTDRAAVVGQPYRGVLVRDGEEHFSFFQSGPAEEKKKAAVRHPHVYRGRCVNITRRSGGAMLPTLLRPRLGGMEGFRAFCREAAEELLRVARLAEETGGGGE